MSYELNVNTNVTGQPQVDALGIATEKLTGKTHGLNDALYGQAKASEAATLQLLKIQQEEVKLEQLRERHRMQQEGLAASTTRGTVAQDQFAGSLNRVGGSARMASSELSLLEGRMTNMAAGRFLNMFAGGAVQALFPIAGAIALLGVAEKIGDKLGIHLAYWKQIADAQKVSNDELRDATKEYDRNLQRLRQLRDEEFRRRNGVEAGARREAGESDVDAGTALRQSARLQREANALRRITTFTRDEQGFGRTPVPTLDEASTLAGVFEVTPGRALSSTQMKAAQARIPGLERDALAMRSQALAKSAEASEKRAQADEDASKKAEEATRKREAQENRIIEIEKRAADEWERSLGKGGGPLAALTSALAVIGNETEDSVRRNPGSAARLRTSGMVRSEAAMQTFRREQSAAMNKLDDENPASRLLATLEHDLHQLLQAGIETQHNLGLGTVIGDTSPAPPPGYRSPRQQMRDATRSGASAMRSARGGDPTDIYQAQLVGIEAAYQAELRLAKTEVDRLDAEDAKKDKIHNADMQRLDAIQALIDKQRDSIANAGTGLIMALQHGQGGSFIRAQMEKLEETVIGNVLKMAVNSGTGAKIAGGLHLPGKLGDIFAGTPFGKDPAATATTTNTVATDRNTDAINSLTSAIGGTPGGGGAGTPGGVSGTSSGGATSGIGSTVGTVAKYGAAAFGAYMGISTLAKGGGRNAVAGVGELAGTAAMLDPEPISKAILSAVAIGSGIVTAIMGDPKTNRENQISSTLQHNQFLAPAAIHESMTAGGYFSDFDRFGGVRGSNLSPRPTIEQGYFDYKYGQTIPGRTVSQFGTPQITINVQTMDSKSFNDNSHLVADALQHALQLGRATGLQETLRHM